MTGKTSTEETAGGPGGERTDRRAQRRSETTAEIVAAAWDLVRDEGLAGLSMRDLGRRVGMRAQSIYSYFASKHEIYDAMFLEGYQAFEARTAHLGTDEEIAADPIAYARRSAHAFFAFCTEDPVRYQLLFQRTIPGFEPSPESWAVATEAFGRMVEQLAVIGITDPEGVDLWTAVLTGLTDQQISNDPGGDRWERLVDRAVAMLLATTAPDLVQTTAPGSTR